MARNETEALERQLQDAARALPGLNASEGKRFWDIQVRPRLGEFARLRLAEVAETRTVRDIAEQVGISAGYVSMLTREEEPRNASLSILAALAREFPVEFGVIKDLLAAAPEAVRARLDMDQKRREDAAKSHSARSPQAILREWSVSFRGQRRDEKVWHEMRRLFRNQGATQIVRVDGDWFSPVVEPGDLVFLRDGAPQPPPHRALAIVHTADGEHNLREYDAQANVWRLPSGVAGEDWPAGAVEVDGELIAVLKMRRL